MVGRRAGVAGRRSHSKEMRGAWMGAGTVGRNSALSRCSSNNVRCEEVSRGSFPGGTQAPRGVAHFISGWRRPCYDKA